MPFSRRDFLKTGAVAVSGTALGATLFKEELMAATQKAQAYHEKIFPHQKSALAASDPEFAEFFHNFAFDEVINEKGQELDDKTRFMAILATLLGCQAVDAFRVMLPAALNCGLTPVEVKEIVYQATAYLGLGRVLPFLRLTNDILQERGVKLPLAPQGTTSPENRREKGTAAQVAIFGPGMKEFWQSGPEESRHINRWLADNCFGDYYTRGGLDLRQREMVTFCYIAAQGGCESQLVAHAKGNFNTGNDRHFLIRVISQCLPYIGYPRSLNALRCVNEAAESLNSSTKEKN